MRHPTARHRRALRGIVPVVALAVATSGCGGGVDEPDVTLDLDRVAVTAEPTGPGPSTEAPAEDGATEEPTSSPTPTPTPSATSAPSSPTAAGSEPGGAATSSASTASTSAASASVPATATAADDLDDLDDLLDGIASELAAITGDLGSSGDAMSERP